LRSSATSGDASPPPRPGVQSQFIRISGGIVGALLAAIPGFVDFLSIREADMKRIAILHLSVTLLLSRFSP
jgi:hypothetical protein